MCKVLGWICVLILHSAAHSLNEDYQNDYSLFVPFVAQEPMKQVTETEHIRQKSGSELILKCKCHKDNKNHGVEWEFAKCRNKNNLNWEKIPRKRNCKLHFKNVTSSQDSGFYRCIINGSTETMYEVDIIDIVKYSGDPPKLLDLKVSPNNSLIEPHTNVVVHCKVTSKQIPVILWFKQCDNNAHYDLSYSGKYYSRINTTLGYQVRNEEDVFISKLNLQNLTSMDSGVYVCVAMTELGKDLRSFKIYVMPSYYEQQSSLSVLFLIPVPFILIPICVWLCYYKNKNINEKKNQIPLELVHIRNNDANN